MSEASEPVARPWAWSDSGRWKDRSDWTVPGDDTLVLPGNATRAMQLYSPDAQMAILTACEWDFADGNPKGMVPAPEDAAFILKAVNFHEELLRFCKHAAEILEADDRESVQQLRREMLAAIAEAKETRP